MMIQVTMLMKAMMHATNDGGVHERGNISTNESLSTFRMFFFLKLKEKKKS
jgi:hypothetical protein